MSHTILARKWRPQSFETLVGQTLTVQALKQAISQQRLHHAYLFTGTRGVGKTTLARILAQCLNCDTGITPTPCGQCQQCTQIQQGRMIDFIEIDAASRTKVEDTRELLDNVQYPPSAARYKIYLIDEVHMLSGHSFNALLKTLEEPPEYVKFLLATTDPERLPATVLSRCLQCHLQPIAQTDIEAHLAHILNEEGIGYEENTLSPIAKAGNGSLRDSLSLLEQVIALCPTKISEEAVTQLLGLVPETLLNPLAQSILAHETHAAHTQLTDLLSRGLSPHTLLTQLQTLWHQMTLAEALDNPPIFPLPEYWAQNTHSARLEHYQVQEKFLKKYLEN